MLSNREKFSLRTIPEKWQRIGKIMERGTRGQIDCSVTGDPCIVWDPERQRYHMFYFAQAKIDGIEHNRNAHAIADNPIRENIRNWKKLGEVEFVNHDKMFGKETHKPWILMDPYRPNVAKKWKGYYWLFTATFSNGRKFIQAAYSNTLDGPWVIEPSLNIMPGDEFSPDGLHADAPTAYYFEKIGKILVFYMGYPLKQQDDTPWTPYGSRSLTAEIDVSSGKIEKTGTALVPSGKHHSWTFGYIGGLQLLKAENDGWYAMINASPTPPKSVDEEKNIREPSPSLGGFIFTKFEYPDKGWKVLDKPLEYIENIPEIARKDGEGVNMWRHHMFILPSNDLVCLYNTGDYGNEQMFGKICESSRSCVK
ncbi:MAG: hypothetical protein WC996_09250 [Peptostreptococcales bacterium]